jgi:chemotaxis protein histidine kinase CheA
MPGASAAPRRKLSIDLEAEWERALARARAREVSPTVAKSRSHVAAPTPSRPTLPDYGARTDYAAQLLEEDADVTTLPTAQGYRSPTAQPDYEESEDYAAEGGYAEDAATPGGPEDAYSDEAWDEPAQPIVSGQYAVPPGGYAPHGYPPAHGQGQLEEIYPEEEAYTEEAYPQQGFGVDVPPPALRGGGVDVPPRALRGGGVDVPPRALRGGGVDVPPPAGQAAYPPPGYGEAHVDAQDSYAQTEPDYAEPSAEHAASQEEEMAAQMYELVERARASDARAEELERKLAQQRSLSLAAPIALPSDDALTRRKPQGGWIGWVVAGVCASAGLVGYFTAYAPLQQQLLAATKLNQQQSEANTEGVNALRAQFARERQDLEQQLSAAQRAAQEAQANALPAEPEKVRSAAAAAPSHNDDDEGGSKELSASQQERREARLAAREARKAEYEAKKAERLAAREAKKEERAAKRAERSAARSGEDEEDDSSSEDKPAPSKPAPAASEPNEERSGGGDDPLGGLDDL